MAHAPTANHVRFPVDPRDVPASKAARRLHLTESEFREKLSDLLERGFPAPDPTTGMFDLKAIDIWMDSRAAMLHRSQPSALAQPQMSMGDKFREAQKRRRHD